MSFSEIEALIPQLSPEELEKLESAIRAAKHGGRGSERLSILDIPPVSVGKMLKPFGPDDDILEEMLHDTRF